MSPDALYGLYYGTTAETRSEHLFGATLRGEHDWGTDGRMKLGLSRQQRAADPTERFIAGNGSSAAARWVGNPDLVAETHHQIQAIVEQGPKEAPTWRGEIWLDRVQDYVRRDRARGQDGVLLADQATIYHNGQALLAGAVGSGSLPLNGWLSATAEAAWTWGEDLDSGLPLAQIPPLAGRAALKAQKDGLSTQLGLRWAARATRVDDDMATGSGLDAGETPAWAVLDWSARWQLHRSAELSLGIDNLFDRSYAEHLNKPSAFDTTVIRVNEPGRSLWAAASLRF
jgi:iron complex outermembrane receptor protein